jgi:hypothetical protein
VIAGTGTPSLPGPRLQPGGPAWPPDIPGRLSGGVSRALLQAPGSSLFTILADLARLPGTRPTKLSLATPSPRMSSIELAERNLEAIVSRHKPGTRKTYDSGRRLALRWLQREGHSSIDANGVSQLFVDLIDAGYSAETLRCVHNAVKEVAEAIGWPPYWREPGFDMAYHGFLRAAERERGKKPHTPIDRVMWQQLLSEAANERDGPSLLRALHLGFGLFFRIGEARAARNSHIMCGAEGTPVGVLLEASNDRPGNEADRRPKGTRCRGQKEVALCIDPLAVSCLEAVRKLPERLPSEKRINEFIQSVAQSRAWPDPDGTAWFTFHGLRHGRVGDCLRARFSHEQIRAAGRWRSLAAYEVYLN